MTSQDNAVDNEHLPYKVRAKIRREALTKKIRALYKTGYSMDEVAKIVKCSKTTVFFAVNRGRKKIKNKTNPKN